MLNWSNLDEDYMGILNCCTLGLPLCFSKDGTDRQAFSYIYKEVIYIYIFFYASVLPKGKTSLMY